MNATKQAKINGGASSQIPTFWFPIIDEPPLLQQRTKAITLFNEWAILEASRFAYPNPIDPNWVPPWRSLSERWSEFKAAATECKELSSGVLGYLLHGLLRSFCYLFILRRGKIGEDCLFLDTRLYTYGTFHFFKRIYHTIYFICPFR